MNALRTGSAVMVWLFAWLAWLGFREAYLCRRMGRSLSWGFALIGAAGVIGGAWFGFLAVTAEDPR